MAKQRSVSADRSAEIMYGTRILLCEILNPEDRGLLLIAPNALDIPEIFILRLISSNTEHLARVVLRKKAEDGILLLVSLLEPKE